MIQEILQQATESCLCWQVREATISKLKLTEQQREELEFQKEQQQNEINRLEKEIEIQSKLTENEKKRLEEYARERDLLTKMKTEVKIQ